MPLLLEALAQLAKEKPEEPIEFIAKYLLDHNPEKNWKMLNNLRFKNPIRRYMMVHFQ